MRRGGVSKRWDPNYCHTIGVFLEKIDSSHVPVHKLKKFIEYIQYGISERATSEIVGIPMLRMLNLQDSDWDIRDLKYIDLSKKDKNSYLVNKKDILFNRTNSKELVGKCAVFDLPGEYVFASYLIRVRVRSSYLIPEYLVIFLESSLGRTQIDAVSRQIAGMTNINAEEIRDFLIPIPSFHLQSKIVETWNQALTLRNSLVSQAQAILASIDDYLLDALGITLPPESENTIGNRIFRTRRRNIERRFDPAFYSYKFERILAKIKKLPHQFLGKICNFSNEQWDIRTLFEDNFPYLEISAINTENGEIEEIFTISKAEAPSRARMIVRHNDLLVSTTRPNRGAITISTQIDPFIASTGFCIIRNVDFRKISKKYLLIILRSRLCLDQMEQRSSGGNYPAITSTELRQVIIPLPSLIAQEKIINKVDEIKKQAKTLRHEAEQVLEQAKRKVEEMLLLSGSQE